MGGDGDPLLWMGEVKVQREGRKGGLGSRGREEKVVSRVERGIERAREEKGSKRW